MAAAIALRDDFDGPALRKPWKLIRGQCQAAKGWKTSQSRGHSRFQETHHYRKRALPITANLAHQPAWQIQC